MPHRATFVWVIAVALLYLSPAAQAAPPLHDDITGAAVVSSLPFTDSLSTVEATTAPDDPDCFGSGSTVWYVYTPESDILIDANTFGSDYDTTLSVYTGSPGALTQLGCADDSQGAQSQVVFNATAGVTYYFMVGSFGGSVGGNLQFSLQERLPPPDISVSVSSGGSVDRNGVATINGTVSCDQSIEVNVGGSLTQYFARRVLVTGYFSTSVPCTPPSSTWSAQVPGSNGRFGAGRAQADVSASACTSSGCDYDAVSRQVKLTGRR